MTKRLNDYYKILSESIAKSDIKKLNELHEDFFTQLTIFMNERLIHLLVTLFVALLTVSVFFYILVSDTGNFFVYILFALLFILTFFYIKHYYFLENKIQAIYILYDKMNDI